LLKFSHISFVSIISKLHEKQTALQRAVKIILDIYTVSQKKTCHQTFVYIFTKYRPILKILSLTYSAVNLQ